ncbi:MAG TPA: helix-turn-helix transcriptional regulator [Gemmatirosa sp.]
MSSVHTPAYQHLLGRLRDARREAGLTQVELARRIGKRQAYVSRCELGERRLDVIELLVWADALSQPLEYFLPPRSIRLSRRAR